MIGVIAVEMSADLIRKASFPHAGIGAIRLRVEPDVMVGSLRTITS
jgi:hypothetical protein